MSITYDMPRDALLTRDAQNKSYNLNDLIQQLNLLLIQNKDYSFIFIYNISYSSVIQYLSISIINLLRFKIGF